jgi:hypothetical protein
MSKKVDAWFLSIEDSGSPSVTTVHTTHKEAVARLRKFLMEIMGVIYDVQVEYDESVEVAHMPYLNDGEMVSVEPMDAALHRHATMMQWVEERLPKPDQEVYYIPLDNRVVWLEKHTVEIAAREQWEPDDYDKLDKEWWPE